MGAGYGTSGPLAATQRMRLSSSSGARSYSRKFIFALRLAPGAFGEFFASRSILGVFTSYGSRDAFWPKQANIGVAPPSYWVIGGSPRISSIVRTMLAVV